ncbi:MAG: redoxin domain-containing protein [Nitrospira sp.]|nr:redoxin domain-containing protein [Nitrospira sp.]
MDYKSGKIVRRIGQKALTFRFPAVVDGEVSYIGPKEFLGQWLVLSFVPALGESEIMLWNRHGQELAELGVALLLVPPEAQTLHGKQSFCTQHMHFVVAGDPMRRLQRLYGGPTTQSPGRGRTFLIDPDGLLRFHLVHSLTERGMGVLTELLQAYQDAEIAAVV